MPRWVYERAAAAAPSVVGHHPGSGFRFKTGFIVRAVIEICYFVRVCGLQLVLLLS